MIGDLGSALITDEPGTGKTITTILGLVTRSSYLHNFGPVLVVCPASVVDPWVEAWRDWAPHVRAVAWRGTPPSAWTCSAPRTSTSPATRPPPGRAAVRWHAGKKLSPLTELGAGALVVDECHLIKNNQTARSQRCAGWPRRSPKGGPVVALSGTPITHHPGDLWPTLDAWRTTPGRPRSAGCDRYCLTLKGDYEERCSAWPRTEPSSA
jgi:SNF2 family DNA or RNA helicase